MTTMTEALAILMEEETPMDRFKELATFGAGVRAREPQAQRAQKAVMEGARERIESFLHAQLQVRMDESPDNQKLIRDIRSELKKRVKVTDTNTGDLMRYQHQVEGTEKDLRDESHRMLGHQVTPVTLIDARSVVLTGDGVTDALTSSEREFVRRLFDNIMSGNGHQPARALRGVADDDGEGD